MKFRIGLPAKIPGPGLALVLVCLAFAPLPARACTIFVLTDTNRALFCNNEDWSNPKTRIWFMPAGDGCYGAVYVGFDDGYAQGGMNTEGLACDWVAGFKEEWKPDPHLPIPRRDSSQRMLETWPPLMTPSPSSGVIMNRGSPDQKYWWRTGPARR